MRGEILVLTGRRGIGKSTLCLRAAEAACRRGLAPAGVISPARFAAGRKVGIDLLDVRGGKRRPLAVSDQSPGPIRTQSYRFRPEAMIWGAGVIAAAPPCRLLIVDELGPLELVRGQGWTVALEVLRAGRFDLALVVVRPGLVHLFHQRIPDRPVELLPLPAPAGTDPLAEILARLE